MSFKWEDHPMKANYKLAIALLAGAGIGALATQGLRAQAKPVAYVIAEIDVTNPDAYAKDYAPLAQKALRDGGAKYLALAGKTTALDGPPPKSRVTLSSYENIGKAQAAFNSPAYREARKIGDKYAKFRIFAVEGAPQ
jgi:uncharacterized protein (DUF1330 family)